MNSNTERYQNHLLTTTSNTGVTSYNGQVVMGKPLTQAEMQKQSMGTSSTSSSSNGNIVGVHYKVGKKIGEGSFGVLYEGVNLLNKQTIAIKFEPRKSDAPQLRDEFRTYKIMRNTGEFHLFFLIVLFEVNAC